MVCTGQEGKDLVENKVDWGQTLGGPAGQAWLDSDSSAD